MTKQAVEAYEELKAIRIDALREGRFEDYDRISSNRNNRGEYRNFFVSGGRVRDFKIGKGVRIV